MIKKIVFSFCLLPGFIYSMGKNGALPILDMQEEIDQKLELLMAKIQHKDQVYQGQLKDLQKRQEDDKKFAEEMIKMVKEITKK